MQKYGVEFVRASDLFEGFMNLFYALAESVPDFSWGDNDHSLVTLSRLLNALDEAVDVIPEAFLARCRQLGRIYVDLGKTKKGLAFRSIFGRIRVAHPGVPPYEPPQEACPGSCGGFVFGGQQYWRNRRECLSTWPF